MKYRIRFRPVVADEIEQAYAWYEEQRVGLGDDLVLCIEAAVEAIRENPLRFPVIHRQIRRVLIRRFPYAMFYIIGNETIVVLAVLHCKRRPKRIFGG